MNPDSQHLWRAPQWAFSILLALLGMLGPFSIDTYLPAFSDIGQSLGANPVQMQQTLSAYLFGFAFMALFHGSLSDSLGRRPVVLWGLAAFTAASVGCALSQTIGQLIFFRAMQGLCTGAGIVVSRAVIRDVYPQAQAQKVMSQVTLIFGVAPAIAPLVGGWLLIHVSWHGVFWFLAAVGLALLIANYMLLPETLPPARRQHFHAKNLLAGYWKLGSDPRFFLLALASGIPFNGMFLYVLSAPVFLGEHLGLLPQHFFWFFILTISGIMGGAFLSGRVAGKISPKRQIRDGFVIMLVIGVLNLLANVVLTPHVSWAMFPIAIFSFGWALMMPVVTLLVLDLHPERRGMASSLQMFVGSSANGIVAGVISPLVMHSTIGLATASLLMMGVGLCAWLFIRSRWPEIGQRVQEV
ncbi:multidrug effflux MFS transporter [Rhodoferax sp. OV413]|uniref:multidrug effflux MFS transporter n=1 Tax=Rhodoferax sp. OV413 TaxID=1855285 RepID=UPI0025FCFAD6|nr:multidrug effflux MFS transporter [Rhodoferax sp. OV413]